MPFCVPPHCLLHFLFCLHILYKQQELGKIYLLYLLGSLGSLLPKDLTEEMFWDKGLSRYSVTPRFFWSFELGAIQNGEWGQFLSPTYFVISNSNSHNSIHISILLLFSVWDVPRNTLHVPTGDFKGKHLEWDGNKRDEVALLVLTF